MKKVERSRKSIQLPLRIDASRSFILKPNIILGNSGNGNEDAMQRIGVSPVMIEAVTIEEDD